MSHFYGTLEGSTSAPDGTERKTKAYRGGSAQSGLDVLLRSDEGSIRVSVYEGDDGTGGLEDRVRVRFQRIVRFNPIRGDLESSEGRYHVGQDFELYDGPLSECSFPCIYTNTQEIETPLGGTPNE